MSMAEDLHITYANAARVRARYSDITDMTLWRWLRDEDLGFPKPYVINGRRFWKVSELDEFDRGRRVDEGVA
jgi:hypothetical protein